MKGIQGLPNKIHQEKGGCIDAAEKLGTKRKLLLRSLE